MSRILATTLVAALLAYGLALCPHEAQGQTDVRPQVVPTGPVSDVTASDGSLGGQVELSWLPRVESDGFFHFNIWRKTGGTDYVLVQYLSFATAVAGNAPRAYWVDTVPALPAGSVYTYAVQVCNMIVCDAGMPSDTGYPLPDGGPTSTEVQPGFTNAAVAIDLYATVRNSNSLALHAFAVVTQPPVGQGTISVVNATPPWVGTAATNYLRWTPPVAHDFIGHTTFSFSATDAQGRGVVGTGNVDVIGVPGAAPWVAASDGEYTGQVDITFGGVYWVFDQPDHTITYKILRKTGTTAYALVHEMSWANAAGMSGPGWVDTVSALPVGSVYTYAVQVCNTMGCNASMTTDTGFPMAGSAIPAHAVNGMRASDGTLAGRVLLEWTPPSDYDSTYYYVVERHPSDSSNYTFVNTHYVSVGGGGGIEDIVGVLPAGGTYTYTVVPCNSSGCNTNLVAYDTGYPGATLGPTSTAAYVYTNAGTAATISQVRVDDGVLGKTYTFAVVSQPAAGQGAASIVANKLVWTPPYTHTFTGTTTFTYSAADANGHGVNGTATVVVIGAPVDIVGFGASKGDVSCPGLVRTSFWAPMNPLADDSSVYYKLFRKTASTSYVLVHTFSYLDSFGVGSGNSVWWDSVPALTAGGVYTYAMQMCNPMGCNANMATDTGYPYVAAIAPAFAVDNLRASDGTGVGRVLVEWGAPSDYTSAFYYVVQRASGIRGAYVTLNAHFVPAGGNGSFEDIVAALAPGGVYVYRVQACNATGCSSVVATDTGYPVPTVLAPASPATAVSATDGTGIGRVDVTWDSPADANSGFYYVVRRKAPSDRSFSIIATVSESTLVHPSWTDTTAALPVGAVYSYTVQVCNSGGCNAALPTDTGYPAIVIVLPIGQVTDVRASQGTLTGGVVLSWKPYATESSAAMSYQIWRHSVDGRANSSTPILVKTISWTEAYSAVTQRASWTDPVSALPVGNGAYLYEVKACTTAGCLVPQTVTPGFPNIAPTATEMAIYTDAVTPRNGYDGNVHDLNNADVHTFAVLTQPPAGEGSVSVVNTPDLGNPYTANQLRWTPPRTRNYIGTTHFTYTATDRGGASVTGTATVVVAGAPSGPASNVAATDGTIAGKVDLSWIASPGANPSYSFKVWRKTATSAYALVNVVEGVGFSSGFGKGGDWSLGWTDIVGSPVDGGVYTYAVQTCNPVGCDTGMPSDTGYPTTPLLSRPTITFVPMRELTPPANAPSQLTRSTGIVAGTIRVTAPVPGFTVRITPSVGPPVEVAVGATSYARLIETPAAAVGSTVTYTVEAYPTLDPEKIANKPLVFAVAPPEQTLTVKPPTTILTTEPLEFAVRIGAADAPYSATTNGIWSVTLHSVSPTGALIPLVTQATTTGKVILSVAAADAGRGTFTAVATLTNGPVGFDPKVIRSLNVSLLVRDGATIPATLATKPVSGAGRSPLYGMLAVTLQEPKQFLDVGTVTYYVSSDGTHFAPLLDADGVAVAAILQLSNPIQLDGNIKRYYKATVANKWSGNLAETNVVSLESFHIPLVTISVPKVTVANHPVTMTAVSDSAVPLTYLWTVTFGRNAPVTASGASFTYTPASAGPIKITLATRETAALDVPAAWKSAVALTTSLLPTLGAPLVMGTIVAETGQTYTWTAMQRSPFPFNSGTDLVVKSQWVLPDGTNSTANPVTYTMKAGDQPVIRYESVIEGIAESAVHTDHVLRSWTYAWPAWKMLTQVVSPYAPARVSLAAVLVTPMQMVGLHGEALTYAWTFPQGATVVSQKDGLATVEFPAAGTYHVSAVVSDTRGNSSTVTSQDVTIQPPKGLAFDLALAVGDRWNRPPGPVMARITTTSVPSGDTVGGVTFFVDNQQVGGEVFSGAATINLPQPGTYTVKAVLRSAKGVTSEATQQVTLTLGDPPACVLKRVGNGTTTLAFSSNCTVQKGLVVRYQWIVNEDTAHPSQVTANNLSFPVSLIAGVQTVRVVATTDRGDVGGARFSISTGVSTPSP